MFLGQNVRSSTDIMTDNIIKGFIDNDYDLTLFIIGNSNEKEDVINRYNKHAKVFFRQALIPKNTNNLKNIFLISKYNVTGVRLTRKEIDGLSNFDPENTLLISHSPSIETVFICKNILKKYHFHYVQYVSDPLALEGKLPETMGVKRVPFRIIEQSTIRCADEVVYVTKSLMRFQSELYPKYAGKMRFINASYTPRPAPVSANRDDTIRIVYSGNYYSRIRNIIPLYEAMRLLDDKYQLSIYGSTDLTLKDTRNVCVHNRIDSESIKVIENDADVLICILNTNCIQVPGKIFYNTDSNQRILIISDGPYGNKICEDLKTLDRFDFCNNTDKSIASKIMEIAKLNKIDGKQYKDKLSPKHMAGTIALGDVYDEMSHI